MIPLVYENPASLQDRKLLGCGVEVCVFCSKPTNTWHHRTNNPICLKCAKIHKVVEIPEDWGEVVRKNERKARKAGLPSPYERKRAN